MHPLISPHHKTGNNDMSKDGDGCKFNCITGYNRVQNGKTILLILGVIDEIVKGKRKSDYEFF